MHLVYISMHTQNSFICSEDIKEKHFLHQSRAIILLFINEFSPFAIANHPSRAVINGYAKFEEDRSKTTQVKSPEMKR